MKRIEYSNQEESGMIFKYKDLLWSIFKKPPKFIPELKERAQEYVGGKIAFAKYLSKKFKILGLGALCIVDNGCGTGTLAKALAMQLPDSIIVGCDIKNHTAETNTETPKNFLYKAIKPFALNKEGLKPDIIILSNVVHHIVSEDEGKMFKDVYGALPPKGLLIIHEHRLSEKPGKQKIERLCLNIAEAIINKAFEDMVCSFNFFTKKRLIETVEKYRFEIIEENDVDGKYVTIPQLSGNTVYFFRKK